MCLELHIFIGFHYMEQGQFMLNFTNFIIFLYMLNDQKKLVMSTSIFWKILEMISIDTGHYCCTIAASNLFQKQRQKKAECLKEHTWLGKHQLENWIIWNVWPINELLHYVVISSHGQNWRSRHKRKWIYDVISVEVSIQYSRNLTPSVKFKFSGFDV